MQKHYTICKLLCAATRVSGTEVTGMPTWHASGMPKTQIVYRHTIYIYSEIFRIESEFRVGLRENLREVPEYSEW